MVAAFPATGYIGGDAIDHLRIFTTKDTKEHKVFLGGAALQRCIECEETPAALAAEVFSLRKRMHLGA